MTQFYIIKVWFEFQPEKDRLSGRESEREGEFSRIFENFRDSYKSFDPKLSASVGKFLNNHFSRAFYANTVLVFPMSETVS